MLNELTECRWFGTVLFTGEFSPFVDSPSCRIELVSMGKLYVT